MILDDCDGDEFSEDEIEYIIEEILIPGIAIRFAEHYDGISKVYNSDPDPKEAFETFCAFEGLADTNLANAVATAINEAAAAINSDDDWDERDWENPEDEDDNDVVFKGQEDWKHLSPVERQDKVKAFLRKLASVGSDAKNLKPFLKNLNVSDQENPYGVEYGYATNVFDRAANHYGHDPAPTNYGRHSPSNESLLFPSHNGTGHDEFHRAHPLHKTLLKFGYQYSHTVPVTTQRGVHHHHTWVHSTANHQVGSYEGSTEWSSKTHAASGHVFTGVGTKALEQHLQNKAKRYKLQNNDPYYGSVRHNQESEETLPATKIQESLIDPAGYKRVARYAEWMKKNPATAFGVQGGSYAVESPAKALVEAEKLKAKVEKRFGQGKDQSEWGLFDARSGKPK